MRRCTTPARGAAHLALLTALVASSFGCGAKTGLDAPDYDARPDAGTDAGTDIGPDVPRPVRVTRCFPQRVRTRVGFPTNLRPDMEAFPLDGYTWSLRSRPMGSSAMIDADGTELAVLRPDVAGDYDVLVVVASPEAPGGALQCPILVTADPPDPRCPGYALVEPRATAVPNGTVQLALDPRWGVARTTSGAGAGAVLADDAEARVAVAVIERALTADPANPARALEIEGAAVESAVTREFGASAVFVGRGGTTHDGHPLRRTTLRIGTGTVSDPGELRDRALRAVASLPPPADPAPAHTRAAAFYVEVTTVVRADTRRAVIVLALVPVATFDDLTSPASIRVNDVANTTAIAAVGRELDVTCQQIFSTRTLTADFLWLVDTSGSMNNDQQRVGNTAERFFRDLTLAGVDFRVGVLQAGSRPLNLTPNARPAFRWIPGDAPDGARDLAFQVTTQPYGGNAADTQQPFGTAASGLGMAEEPVAAAVIAIREFERRRAAGETNPEFVLRENTARVVFFVTDESVPDLNEVRRFFGMDMATWGTNETTRLSNITQFFTSRSVLPFGLVPETERCPSDGFIPACVTTAGGGAYIPIGLRNDSEVNAAFASAMNRVVDSVAGAASEFVLPTPPLSESLRARVDGRIAPRSRADGFDYDDRTRSLVFRGPSFRPRPGQDVRAAYFFWRTP